MEENVIAIVPAAGLGTRLGRGAKKPFYSLLGRPLIAWTLEALERIGEIGEIIPVIRESEMQSFRRVLKDYAFSKIKRIAAGGRERQDSVYSGLKLLDEKTSVVVIHDGVRPFLDESVLREALTAVEKFDGAVAAVPVKDTIKEVKDGVVTGTLKRETLWAVQTPQVFRYGAIMKAYRRAMEEGFYATDDSALLEKIGGMVKIVTGSYSNIKITTPDDILFAEFLLERRLNKRETDVPI